MRRSSKPPANTAWCTPADRDPRAWAGVPGGIAPRPGQILVARPLPSRGTPNQGWSGEPGPRAGTLGGARAGCLPPSPGDPGRDAPAGAGTSGGETDSPPAVPGPRGSPPRCVARGYRPTGRRDRWRAGVPGAGSETAVSRGRRPGRAGSRGRAGRRRSPRCRRACARASRCPGPASCRGRRWPDGRPRGRGRTPPA